MRNLSTEDFSPGFRETIMASWRPGTRTACKMSVRKWLKYCRRQDCDPRHPGVREVLELLQSFSATVVS